MLKYLSFVSSIFVVSALDQNSSPSDADVKEPNLLLKILIGLGKLDMKPTLEGKTWSEMTFRERVLVYNWSLELSVLAFFVFYVLTYLNGCRRNSAKVDSFIKSTKGVFDANFGYLGCTPAKAVIKDSNSRFTYYASGRINVESLVARFRLIDRHNILVCIAGLVVPGFSSQDGLGDHIEIDLTPTDPAACEPGIFGVVNKSSLATVSSELYFSKFAKFVDNEQLPQNYLFLQEHSDQVAALFTEELKQAVSNPASAKVLRFLVFSDIPSTEPKKESEVSASRQLRLSLNFPTNAEEELAVVKILEATIQLVDRFVTKPRYTQSISKRINANREVEYTRIRKIAEAARKEDLDLKKAEERREAARRESLLSEDEQRKLKAKEQSKQARKQKKKMTRKG